MIADMDTDKAFITAAAHALEQAGIHGCDAWFVYRNGKMSVHPITLSAGEIKLSADAITALLMTWREDTEVLGLGGTSGYMVSVSVRGRQMKQVLREAQA